MGEGRGDVPSSGSGRLGPTNLPTAAPKASCPDKERYLRFTDRILATAYIQAYSHHPSASALCR